MRRAPLPCDPAGVVGALGDVECIRHPDRAPAVVGLVRRQRPSAQRRRRQEQLEGRARRIQFAHRPVDERLALIRILVLCPLAPGESRNEQLVVVVRIRHHPQHIAVARIVGDDRAGIRDLPLAESQRRSFRVLLALLLHRPLDTLFQRHADGALELEVDRQRDVVARLGLAFGVGNDAGANAIDIDLLE